MKWVLALIAASGLGMAAHAEPDPPLTLGNLFTISPQEAARRLFGPTPEVFVERSPWNSLQSNFILNTVGQFQMELFTRPERIAPKVCQVTMGWARFDTGPPKDLSAEEKAAWTKLGYGDRPLKLLSWNRQQQYFAAGPARAAPVEPGGKPVTPSNEALAADSCENPVVLRGRFEAPSPEAAILLVSKAEAAVAAAKSRKRLPFQLEETCQSGQCRPRRALLASLRVDQIRGADVDDGCMYLGREERPSGAGRCLSLNADDPTLGGDDYWRITLVLDQAGALRKVIMNPTRDFIP